MTEDDAIIFDEIPSFTPETFAFLHNTDTAKYKRFRDGLRQLLQEGAVQCFNMTSSTHQAPLLAAVGPLQFDVVRHRLENEYGASCRFEPTPYEHIRWVRPRAPGVKDLEIPFSAATAIDAGGNQVILFPDEWALRRFVRHEL